MGVLEPGLFIGRPCDLPGCAASADPSMSFAHRFSLRVIDGQEVRVRAVALDVHRDFCEVAIAEGGFVRAAGRIETERAALALFAESLAPTHEVAIEATANGRSAAS